jgi:hypothetical protein
VSAFTADWLARREAADAVARSRSLTQTIASLLPDDRELHALDLAAGTGSNVRYLANRLARKQSWLLVDNDPALIDQIPAGLDAWSRQQGYQSAGEAGGLRVKGETLSCRIVTSCIDVARLDDPRLFDGRALVTASALLDLVSERWLRDLATRCRGSGAMALFALTYDGRTHCTPEDPDDETIRDLVNRHQRTDKGFGDALGPDAATRAVSIFSSAGYEVRLEPSDWVLSPDDCALQRQLIAGWAEAATAMAPEQRRPIEEWRTRRLSHLDEHRSRLTVGHQDLGAWLEDAGPRAPFRLS